RQRLEIDIVIRCGARREQLGRGRVAGHQNAAFIVRHPQGRFVPRYRLETETRAKELRRKPGEASRKRPRACRPAGHGGAAGCGPDVGVARAAPPRPATTDISPTTVYFCRTTIRGPMAVASKIICPSCGFSNTPPLANNRCVSCGAKIEDLKRSLTRQEELERRYQQEGFSPLWFGVSIAIMSVMTAALVMGLPMVVPAFDFEGSAGMRIS